MTQRDEMRMFGEAIHHGQDNALAMDAQQSFNEIYCNVRPNLGWNWERLEQARRVEGVHLVALAS